MRRAALFHTLRVLIVFQIAAIEPLLLAGLARAAADHRLGRPDAVIRVRPCEDV